MPRIIRIASPIEPSGASWLHNCLLELGVKVERVEPSLGPMWIRVGEKHRLSPRHEELKRWLPALSRSGEFSFRRDVEAIWSHDLPERRTRSSGVVLFVRDPRDAFYSQFRRMAPGMSYAAYLEFPDPRSLLSRIEHWRLFVESWLSRPGVRLARFEDYRADAAKLLAELRDFIGLDSSDEAVAHAVESSSFASAARAERQWLSSHPGSSSAVNRAGSAGEWRESEELREASARIGSLCRDTLRSLGYAEGSSPREQPTDLSLHRRRLSYLRRVDIPARLLPPSIPAAARASEERLLAFARGVDGGRLAAARIGNYGGTLLLSLAEFFGRGELERRLAGLYAAYAENPRDFYSALLRVTGDWRYARDAGLWRLLSKGFRRLWPRISRAAV